MTFQASVVKLCRTTYISPDTSLVQG